MHVYINFFSCKHTFIEVYIMKLTHLKLHQIGCSSSVFRQYSLWCHNFISLCLSHWEASGQCIISLPMTGMPSILTFLLSTKQGSENTQLLPNNLRSMIYSLFEVTDFYCSLKGESDIIFIQTYKSYLHMGQARKFVNMLRSKCQI